jgi:hypothetical protein
MQRWALVEPPFGGLKSHVIGNARLLLRGRRGARADMALAILAYQFRRAMNLPTSALSVPKIRTP